MVYSHWHTISVSVNKNLMFMSCLCTFDSHPSHYHYSVPYLMLSLVLNYRLNVGDHSNFPAQLYAENPLPSGFTKSLKDEVSSLE